MNITAKRNSEGYLVDPDEWTALVAKELAAEEEIELNDDVWDLLHFMRDYYTEHKIAPDVRHLIKYLAHKRSCSKKEAKQQVFSYFPYGYVKQACKIAGMKQPRVWSTG